MSSSEQMGSLMKLGQVAHMLGHRLDFLFRPDMYKIPGYDAILIRALTDPLNSSYVVARLAQMNGLRVLDDPDSIYICCDKVNMYRHLQDKNVPMPETTFLIEADLNRETGERLLSTMSTPLVLKAPNSSFSMYVEKVSTPEEFVAVGMRYLRRADRVVAQKFVRSQFDWRVGVLAGQPLFVCQYMIPKKRWKIMTYTEAGRAIYGQVKSIPVGEADPELIKVALAAAAAIGNGLYGVDLKQTDEGFVVIEVNDNPTINEDEEDQESPELYERLITYLAGEWG
jgi:glutathione synthase/RimK-type ligase-like ATP-grasp enzyme